MSALRRHARGALAAGLLAVLSLAASPLTEGLPEFTARERARILKLSPLLPPPPDETNRVADSEAAARLGERLFFEARLAPDRRFSCATCHDPAKAFADGLAVAAGRSPGTRNTPSLVNVAQQRWLNWDGRADTLWAQALDAIEHPEEMAGDRLSAARLVRGDDSLRGAYEAAFGPLPAIDWEVLPARARPWSGHVGPAPAAKPADDALDAAWSAMPATAQQAVNQVFVNLGKAIAAHERTIRSGTTPFDRFVAALRAEDPAARSMLSPTAQRGLKLFVGRANCWLCHNGPMLSDGEFHFLGVPPPDGLSPRDAGRHGGAERVRSDPFNAAGPFSDDAGGPRAELVRALSLSSETWGQFRTPSLREVARTAPYMHAGQLATLRDVLRFYSTLEGQIAGHHGETVLTPLHLTESEMDDLEAFLRALSSDGEG